MVQVVLLVVALLLAAPVRAQDGIDLSQAVITGPPVQTWPATVTVSGVEFAPGESRGVRLIFDRSQVNTRWPDVIVWPPAGYIQWTLYACVRPDRVTWHCGGMHEFWGDRHGAPREWSGAPLLERASNGTNHWQANWAYDGRWGQMNAYVPAAGDEIGFFMVAGAHRPGSSNHPTVSERSNVVRVRLAPSGTATPIGGSTVPPVVSPTGPTPVPPASTPNEAFYVWAGGFERWAREYADWTRQHNEYQTQLLQQLGEQNERIYQDLAARIDASSAKAPEEPVRVDSNNVRGWVSLIMSIGGAVGAGIAGIAAVR